MAAKENQGLQAIVIVLTILLLLTGVGLLLVNNARKTAVAQVTDLQAQVGKSNETQAKLEQSRTRSGVLVTWSEATRRDLKPCANS